MRREIIDDLRLHTSDGVHSFLYRWHEIGEDRFRGDLSVSVARLDVLDAMHKTGMWSKDVETFYIVYFRGYTVEEAARELGVDKDTVRTRLERGCTQIAEWLSSRGYGIE